ncbi:YchJ family protein [Micromonospora sp. NPDC048871]|uniref:YchJ family protein n=1 Tax=unclassified Micromonospora TaxID=2617518 RepID=UPI002E123200|nr:YchJ family protein [Micromonospora sp. NBC_01739]
MARRDSRSAPRPDPVGVCPCGQGLPYGDCCGRLHRGAAQAPTAEALMRSRYAAFAVGDPDYLRHSWHSSTRPARLILDPGQRWTGLEIVGTEQGGLFDSTGTVEFRAHYRDNAGAATMTERSRFVREDGRWVYLDVDRP